MYRYLNIERKREPCVNTDKQSVSLSGLISLFTVYLAWGSTYLAIRVAVRDGSGIEPFTLGASRTLVASIVLITIAFLMRKRIRPTKQEIYTLAISGGLLWLGGNGMVNWAEQYIDSGLTALLVGTLPIMVATMEAILDRKPPGLLMTVSLLIGFAGLGTLVWPILRLGTHAHTLAVIALIIGPISWGAGSILLARRPVDMHPLAISGYQQAFGSLFFWSVALILGEPMMNPSPDAWLAWSYLLIVGSLVAMTAYMIALKQLPTSLVMTYPYVNPVIAVFLGWLLLKEDITIWTMAGAVLILTGVAGVFRAKGRGETRKG